MSKRIMIMNLVMNQDEHILKEMRTTICSLHVECVGSPPRIPCVAWVGNMEMSTTLVDIIITNAALP